MNSTQILNETFASHEHLTPDADLALDGIQHRLRTRRRSRVAMAGVVAAVAATAVGAAFLTDAADHANHATRAPAAHQPTAAKTQLQVPLPAPDHITIAAGWLPAGTVKGVVLDNGFGQQARGYDVTADDGSSVYVLIGTQPGTSLPATYKRGTAHDRSVNGRSAREWSVDDWYHLAILLPDVQVATVEIEGGPNQGKGGDGSAAALAAIGRKVGEHLDLNRHDSITPGFALSYLPAGVVTRAVGRDAQSGTSYTLASPGAQWSETMPNYATVNEFGGLWSAMRTSQKGLPPASPGRAVQGHPTYVVSGGKVPYLWIDGVRPGISISIIGGPGVTTLAEVYKIADGLILTR